MGNTWNHWLPSASSIGSAYKGQAHCAVMRGVFGYWACSAPTRDELQRKLEIINPRGSARSVAYFDGVNAEAQEKINQAVIRARILLDDGARESDFSRSLAA